MTKFIELTEDTFAAIFKPVKNHLVEFPSFDWGDGFGTLFETYGDEHDYVTTQNTQHVWTLCSGEQNDHIISGYHLVNRIGYFITENPFPEGVEIKVTLPNVDEDETEADTLQSINQLKAQVSELDTETLQQLLANLDQELTNRIDSDFLFIQWHIDDVREIRSDLTTDQCREVLQNLQKQHNAEIGINWDVIAITAKDLYPLQEENSSKIAELNDLCRKAMGVAGRLIQTEGINALPPEEQSAIREKVENFSDFSEGDDPYGERDFGAFEHNGQKIFWKIDYYAPDLFHGSENPADPAQTVRVLTILLASEY